MSDTVATPLSAFDYAFKVVIGEEGNYSNNPSDPGGETKYGISKAAYPNLDIACLTLPQAKAIYLSDYWDKFKCSSFPSQLGIILFDCAVNQGGEGDARLMQRAFGQKQDGIIGKITIGAVNDYVTRYGLNAACVKMLNTRLQQYLAGKSSYINGFENRLFNIALCAAQF